MKVFLDTNVLVSGFATRGLCADVIRLALAEHEPIAQPKPNAFPPIPVRDEDDQWVLASALAAKADVLVTGDTNLLDIAEQVTGLTITDPRGFWSLVKKRPRK